MVSPLQLFKWLNHASNTSSHVGFSNKKIYNGQILLDNIEQ